MNDDDKTPTDKPIPPVPAPTGEPAPLPHLADALADVPSSPGAAPTITLEEDNAGELHQVDAIDAPPAPARVELCGARCGTSRIFCGLDAGHEDPTHPAHVKNEHGEAMHVAREARWPVDVEAARAAANERSRSAFEAAKKFKADAGEV